MEILKNLVRDLGESLPGFLEIDLFDAEGAPVVDDQEGISLQDLPSYQRRLESGLETLKGGVSVRSIVVPLREAGAVCGYIRVRLNLAPFQGLYHLLAPLFSGSAAEALDSSATGDWQSQLDGAIAGFLGERRKTLDRLTRQDKQELIQYLNKRKLLQYQEATKVLSGKLGVSRATVYNYLKAQQQINRVRIHQVNAFTDEPFHGNPAGVVLDADHLSVSTMRHISIEMNLSETAFVLPSHKSDFKLRYFTRNGSEIDFCGHSSIGALQVLSQQASHKGRDRDWRVETALGQVKMGVMHHGENQTFYYLSPKVRLVGSKITLAQLVAEMGVGPEAFAEQPKLWFETTNKDLFVSTVGLKAMEALQPDFRSLGRFNRRNGITVVCALALETYHEDSLVHMRCFAPSFGIHEDPFTGSVLGGLTAYLLKTGVLEEECGSFQVEQGHGLGRPGLVRIEYERKSSRLVVRVLAKAVHFFATEITLGEGDKAGSGKPAD